MYHLPDCSNIPNKCNTQVNEFCAMIIHCWSHLSDIILTLFIDQNNWTVFPRRLSILLHWCSILEVKPSSEDSFKQKAMAIVSPTSSLMSQIIRDMETFISHFILKFYHHYSDPIMTLKDFIWMLCHLFQTAGLTTILMIDMTSFILRLFFHDFWRWI